jgi:hypothetical protein
MRKELRAKIIDSLRFFSFKTLANFFLLKCFLSIGVAIFLFGCGTVHGPRGYSSSESTLLGWVIIIGIVIILKIWGHKH